MIHFVANSFLVTTDDYVVAIPPNTLFPDNFPSLADTPFQANSLSLTDALTIRPKYVSSNQANTAFTKPLAKRAR